MSHSVDAVCVAKRPRGQEEHVAEPAEENVPGEHSIHFVLPLVSSLYVPSEHTLHSEFPCVEVYLCSSAKREFSISQYSSLHFNDISE